MLMQPLEPGKHFFGIKWSSYMSGKKFLLFFIVLLGLCPALIFAGGTNRSPIFGARLSGLNGLYFAGSDGISNIYLNPAGLAYQKEKTFEATLFFKSEQNSFNGDVRGIYNSLDVDDENFGVGFYWPVLENLTFGVAYQGVFNYKTDWPYTLIVKSNDISNVTTTDMFYSEVYKKISPVVSYKIGDFAFGFSANFVNVDIETAFAQQNYDWDEKISQPVYDVKLKKKGWLWNFNIGLIYNFSESFKIGAAFSNGLNDVLEGTAESKLYSAVDSAGAIVSYSSNYQTPIRIGAGVLYKLNNSITLNFDLRYNLYGNLDEEIYNTFNDNIWTEKSKIVDTLTGFSVSSFPQYFNNSIDFGIGMEYLATEDLDIVFGYRFSQSPNSEKSFSLLNPVVDQHNFSAGLVYRDNQMILEGNLIYFFGTGKEIKNSLFEVHNGEYKTSGIIPTLSLKYRL